MQQLKLTEETQQSSYTPINGATTETRQRASEIEALLKSCRRFWWGYAGLGMSVYILSLQAIIITLLGSFFYLEYMRHAHLIHVLNIRHNGNFVEPVNFGSYYLNMGGSMAIVALILQLIAYRVRSRRNELTVAVAQLETPEAIEPLVNAARAHSAKLRGIAETALRRLLPLHSDSVDDATYLIRALGVYNPELRAEVATSLAHLLPRLNRANFQIPNTLRQGLNGYMIFVEYLPKEEVQGNSFWRTLKLLSGRGRAVLLPQEKDLVLALLRAYPAIGDGTEMSAVRNIARGNGVAGRDVDISGAAKEYLSYVERRDRGEEQSAVLLRGSSAAGIGTDTLLRATDTTHTASPHELLRPESSDSIVADSVSVDSISVDSISVDSIYAIDESKRA